MPFPYTSESLMSKVRSFRIPPSALIGAFLLAAICVAVLVMRPFSGEPAFVAPTDSQEQAEDFPAEENGSSEGASEEDASAASDQEVPPSFATVHVAGAVASPGLYTVAEGARVQDAVDAAGGLAKDAAPDAINLARPLQDGEQVVIPTKDQVAHGMPAVGGGEGQSDATGGAATTPLVNINTAGLAELDELPGVGPATAQAIIDEREANGSFASAEDIQRVSGIGEKKYEKLKDSICV